MSQGQSFSLHLPLPLLSREQTSWLMVVGLLPKSTVKYKPSFPYKEIYLFPASFFSKRGTQPFVGHWA